MKKAGEKKKILILQQILDELKDMNEIIRGIWGDMPDLPSD